MRKKGLFIIIDGIAGSGKSTILKAVQDWAVAQQYKIFRLADWKLNEPPEFENLADNDVFFTYEPTRAWIGAAIRYEMSKETQCYGGEEIAHAFALDRQIMYKRLIIPALSAGKTVIQDRGVSTSFVYQPIMKNSVPLETIKNYPGNKLALEHAPSAIILTKISAQKAYERIQSRKDESKGVFEQLEFLKQLEERFKQGWLRELFEQNGTKFFELDTEGALEQTKNLAKKLIEQIFLTS